MAQLYGCTDPLQKYVCGTAGTNEESVTFDQYRCILNTVEDFGGIWELSSDSNLYGRRDPMGFPEIDPSLALTYFLPVGKRGDLMGFP